MSGSHFQLANQQDVRVLRLQSADLTNRLSRERVLALTAVLHELAAERRSLVITGNDRFFSVGAELEEIAALEASSGYEFSKIGQALMQWIEQFPAPVYAAVSGYCMGGGLDLALACRSRIASPRAIFGHRGAALGLITGWGGTQRLPRLVGKARALEMFVTAGKLDARQALAIGLIDAVVEDPVAEAVRRAMSAGSQNPALL
jgi:enoyl-CoA hydratase